MYSELIIKKKTYYQIMITVDTSMNCSYNFIILPAVLWAHKLTVMF